MFFQNNSKYFKFIYFNDLCLFSVEKMNDRQYMTIYQLYIQDCQIYG